MHVGGYLDHCVVSLSLLDSQNMENNWKNARHTLTRIECHSENSKGVYCLQYDDHKIISGLRDNTIKVMSCVLGNYCRVIDARWSDLYMCRYSSPLCLTDVHM